MIDKDHEVCMCFHVALGKIAKYHRLHKPALASEFAHCYGAGTGCGWCIPFLDNIYRQLEDGEPPSMALSAEEYARRRRQYREKMKHQDSSAAKPARPIELDLEGLYGEVPDDMKME